MNQNQNEIHSYIPAPTTDNNTSRCILNVGRRASNRHGIVREFHIVWVVVTLIILLLVLVLFKTVASFC